MIITGKTENGIVGLVIDQAKYKFIDPALVAEIIRDTVQAMRALYVPPPKKNEEEKTE